ncbi:MAG: Crp/Fnr family transcriptional regulator [Polyangiaceae bacterium]
MGLHEVLLRTPALAGISPALLDELVSAAEVRSLERGAYLWHAGDAAEALTVIRTGLVKVVKTGAGGKRSICGLFGAPDTVGDAALWRRIPYPADAIVVTSTGSFVDIPRHAIEPVLERAPQLNRSCAEAVQNKLSALLEKIDVLSAGAVEARLGTLLLNLYDRFGDELEDETRFIPVVLSRQELADSRVHVLRDGDSSHDSVGARGCRRNESSRLRFARCRAARTRVRSRTDDRSLAVQPASLRCVAGVLVP